MPDDRVYTSNLNLVKPDKTDQYNVKDFNDNMDKIDNFAGLTPSKALAADKLIPGRNINGVLFDGTQDIEIPYTGANTDLSNLSDIGEKHFLNKTQLTNCILEAPNGVAEWSGVTPTGSLVNNQGVVSGFSESNYGLIDKTLPSNITSYEFMATFTTALQTEYQGIFANSYTNRATPQIVIFDDNSLYLHHPQNAATWIYVKTTTSLLINTTYQAKGIWDGSNLSLYYKTNQETEFTFVGTTPVSTIYWVEPIGVGCDILGIDPFLGSIDLSQSYIKINGEMWWQGNDLGFNQFRVKQGLKTLIPNGRNEDRTLKNIGNTLSQDLTYTFEDNATGSYWAAVGTSAARLLKTAWEYNNDENYIKGVNKSNATNIGQKAIVTMIGDMEVKNGNIISLVPYNPVNLAKEQDIDGVWTGKYSVIFFEVSFTAGETKTYDLSSVLPNDGNVYEVLFMATVLTTGTAGDTAYLRLSNSLITNAITVCGGATPASRGLRLQSSLNFPISTDRILNVTNSNAANTGTFWLAIYGYRKAR